MDVSGRPNLLAPPLAAGDTRPVTTPSAESFAALARSSPWRWSTLRFTWSPQGGLRPDSPVRAWLRRPDRLRVETLDGDLRAISRDAPRGPVHVVPDLAAGTSVVRREHVWEGRFDAPMYQNYYWVAMLDPVELADGQDPDTDAPVAPLEIDSVVELDHGGRPAWEAVVRPTGAYEPRCSCCSLLRSRQLDVRAAGQGSVNIVLDDYPEASRVRLDVDTGICVLVQAIGGDASIAGHDLRIEAVDEPMDDALFSRR
jgi:hypothetical protein